MHSVGGELRNLVFFQPAVVMMPSLNQLSEQLLKYILLLISLNHIGVCTYRASMFLIISALSYIVNLLSHFINYSFVFVVNIPT